jgi:hypothetical protein
MSEGLPMENPQRRVIREDIVLLIRLLEDQGLQVHSKQGSRVLAYDPQTKEYICGFIWRKGTPESPGRWVFDLAIADVFAFQDLQSILGELQRIQGLRPHAQKAWNEFQASKSNKRWATYLGVLVAFFTARRPSSLESTKCTP